jgi:uncharacterized protein (DUF362 family)
MIQPRSERRLPQGEWSRRAFIGAIATSLIANGCRRAPYDARLFTRPDRSLVGLYPASDYTVDFKDLIARALEDLKVDVRGRRVFLKPNMVEYENNHAINTNPLVVAGAALAFRAAGAASVMVGEGPGHRRDMEYLVTQSGLFEHLRENRIAFIDLNQDDVVDVPLGSRFTGLKRLALPVELLQSDFIVSMPKLKTHHWAGLTASMKNLFGTVPGAVYGWPKNILHRHGIDNSIIDLNATIRPHFTIVDAVIAMEGDGPIMGNPRQLGCVLMGSDLVSVDATCARMIGLDPARIPYLKEAGRFLGHVDARQIDLRGEPFERFATEFDVLDQFKAIRLPRS